MKNKSIFILLSFCLFTFFILKLYAETHIIIYTPNNTPVDAYIDHQPLTEDEIQACYDWVETNYPNAEVIAPPSNQYK